MEQNIKNEIKNRALPIDTSRALQLLKKWNVKGREGADVARQHLRYWLNGGESQNHDKYVKAYQMAFAERLSMEESRVNSLRNILSPVMA